MQGNSISSTARPRLRLLRQALPIVIGAGLFALGVLAIRDILAQSDPQDILRQIRSVSRAHLLMAVAATAVSYAALICYDRIALGYLGKHVPARGVVLGGFLGYAFGNTIGVSMISGAAARYRVYAAFGLTPVEIAGLSAFISIAAGLGISAVGLVALAWEPGSLGKLVPLAPHTIRLIAVAVLVALFAVFGWLAARRVVIRLGGVEIAAPRFRLVLLQFCVTACDTMTAALALWLLLPAGGPSFVAFLPVFAVAMMAGVISHVPGGIGVFETLILAAMPAGLPVTDVAAALVVFRAIYYFLPFALAVVVLAVNEARMAGGPLARVFGEVSVSMLPVVGALRGLIPALVGTVSLAIGVYLIVMAMIPAARPLEVDAEDLFGAIMLEGGVTLSAVLGALLMLLSLGLARRVSGAYWLLQISLLSGVVAVTLNGPDRESALLLLAVAVMLWPFRGEFRRPAKLTRDILSAGWLALVMGIMLAAAALFLLMHQSTPWTGSIWTEFSAASPTPRALRAGLLASALFLFALLWLAMQPAHARLRPPDAATLALARAIIATSDAPEALLALSGDKALMFDETESAFAAYAIQGKSWISLGDPVGCDSVVRELAWTFQDQAMLSGGRPVFYAVTERYLPLWIEAGLTLFKLGEEAIVSLPDFSLAGREFKTMRAAHNKALKSGLVFEILEPPHAPALLYELAEVSEAWLDDKAGVEKGFSVGRFSVPYLNEGPVATVRRDGRLLAFATVLVPGEGKRLAVDMMRYRPEEASGMMEFLFVSLLSHYREAGAETFSLGMAPLSGLGARPGRLYDRFGAMIYRRGGNFYNFEGLRAFKSKFKPQWQPRFLAVPAGVSPILALKDAALMIGGGARGLRG